MEKAALANRYAKEYGLNFCLRLLTFSKSTFYAQKHKCSLTTRYQHLKSVFLKILRKHPCYGYRRLKQELRKRGIVINHKPLLKLLRLWGLSLPRRIVKKRRSGIEAILNELGSAVNLIRATPKETWKPLRMFCTDFTEILYRGGKAYLIPYLDVVSKRICGYAIGKEATTALALKAFRGTKLYFKRKGFRFKNPYVHQDQGTQFTSYQYVGTLVENSVTLSYSRKGTPQDNPEMESFFGRLKDEWKMVFAEANSFEELQRLVSKAIRYYNTSRIHSELNGMSPDEFLNSLPSIA